MSKFSTTVMLGGIFSAVILASPTFAAEVCDETIDVRNSGQPANDFIGRIVELYEDEGRGDPRKYRHVYLFLTKTICFVSKDEDRAAALNIIQLHPINKIPSSLFKASGVTVKGSVMPFMQAITFGTPYAIEVINAK